MILAIGAFAPPAFPHTTTAVPFSAGRAAQPSTGGLPPIGLIDEMVGEPMIYKEALTAINRGDFATAVKFLTTAAVRSPSAFLAPRPALSARIPPARPRP